MRGKLGSRGLVLVAAAALGVPGAGAQTSPSTIIVQVNGSGTVTGGGAQISCGAGQMSCYATYLNAGTTTLNAAASPGWQFSAWQSTGDTGCSGLNPNCSIVIQLRGDVHEPTVTFTKTPLPGTSTLTVSAPTDSAGKGGEVADGPDGLNIDCGSNASLCQWSGVITGSTLTVFETPDPGYSFAGWGGACSGNAKSCTVLLDADRAVNATFVQSAATFPLNVTVTGNGTVTGAGGAIACTSAGGASCSANVASNSSVTLTATAGAGAGFTRWSGDCAGSATACTFPMTGAKNVTAVFSGNGGTTFPLTVSVTGSGTVTGTGIDCGDGGSDCTQSVAAGTTVTLTATPASGAVFQGWGSACTGTAKTCAVRMTAARNVSASFSTVTESKPTLTLSVAGRGSVSGAGPPCASTGGVTTCKHSFEQDDEATLTATPQPGQRFLRWSGACTGSSSTCTVTMDASKSVTATFSGATVQATFGARGPAIVSKTKTGYAVTLRFTVPQRGTARVVALRAGRVVTALAFTAAPGPGVIGPFAVPLPGYYHFELRLGGGLIVWRACLGLCGANAPGGPFTLVRHNPRVAHAGEAWSVTVHFHSTLPAGAHLRVYKQRKLVRDYAFAPPAGEVSAGPFVLTPGNYNLRLTATDAYGRVRTLAWYAFLPGVEP